MIPALVGPTPWSPEFWDLFRARYDTLTPADHAAVMAEFYSYSPVQSHFTLPAILDFFSAYPASRVIEVGGWDGKVASAVLIAHPEITHWTNYEVCCPAALAFACPRYETPDVTSTFVWDLPLSIARYDTLFASHSLEHMKAANIRALLARLPDVRAVYVDAPLPADTQDHHWPGYVGSHVLEIGHVQLEALFTEFGFSCERHMTSPTFGDSIRWFVRSVQ